MTDTSPQALRALADDLAYDAGILENHDEHGMARRVMNAATTLRAIADEKEAAKAALSEEAREIMDLRIAEFAALCRISEDTTP
jgi:hypothetical protein